MARSPSFLQELIGSVGGLARGFCVLPFSALIGARISRILRRALVAQRGGKRRNPDLTIAPIEISLVLRANSRLAGCFCCCHCFLLTLPRRVFLASPTCCRDAEPVRRKWAPIGQSSGHFGYRWVNAARPQTPTAPPSSHWRQGKPSVNGLGAMMRLGCALVRHGQGVARA